MKNIFIGLVLLALNLNFNICGINLGLILDTVGFVFLLIGAIDMLNFEPSFRRIIKYAGIGAGISFVMLIFLFLCDIYVLYLAGNISLQITYLLAVHYVIQAIKNYERNTYSNMNSQKIFYYYIPFAIVGLALLAMNTLSGSTILGLSSIIAGIAYNILQILMLVEVYKGCNMFYSQFQ